MTRPKASTTGREVFTTGQIAKLCKVAPRTVTGWFDRGILPGYRIPLSRDRRVPRDSLVRFLKERGMPLGELERPKLVVLAVGLPDWLFRRLETALLDAKLTEARNGFRAGVLLENLRPDVVILDTSVGRGEVLTIAMDLQQHERAGLMLVIGLVHEDEANPDGLLDQGFADVFRHPFDYTLLAEAVAKGGAS